jgi:hypothetical protein
MKDSNVVPALLLSPVFSSDVVPALLPWRQQVVGVVVKIGGSHRDDAGFAAVQRWRLLVGFLAG